MFRFAQQLTKTTLTPQRLFNVSSRTLSGWKIEKSHDKKALIVTMNTNKVNCINKQFNSDFKAALTVMEKEKMPVVLTSASAKTFSAGLDLRWIMANDVTREESRRRMTETLDEFGDNTMRLFAMPVPTVAALNGHALAGGMIIACACDWRVAVNGDEETRLGAIEVAVGVPFPPFAFEVCRQAVPPQLARDVLLYSTRYSVEDATLHGIISYLSTSRDTLLEIALSQATQLDAGAMAAFGHSKRQLITPSLKYVGAENTRGLHSAMETIFGSDENFNYLKKVVSQIGKKEQ